MTLVKYLPEDGSPSKTTTLGYDFDAAKPTEVTNPKALEKLRGNHFFEVAEEDNALTGVGGASGLEAVHRGRGVYGIKDGGVVLDKVEPMSKDEADAFNAMSDEDKAKYVAAPPAPVKTPAPVPAPATPPAAPATSPTGAPAPTAPAVPAAIT